MQITLEFSDGTRINYGDGRTGRDRDALILAVQKGLHRKIIIATVWDPAATVGMRGQCNLLVNVNDETLEASFTFAGEPELFDVDGG